MNLKNLMVDTKSAWVSYPGMDGFQVEVANLSRERLVALRKGCVETIFDRKTKRAVEELNEKKFVAQFTQATIKGWKGFKYSYLESMILVDISGVNPDDELEYSPENAETLVSNSADFDSWLNEVVFDLDNFRAGRDGRGVGASGDVAA